MASWLETLRASNKTSLIQDTRKWRRPAKLGGQSRWEYEVGEELLPRNMESEGLVESLSNPMFVRKDTQKAFQWRIRNLPYPLETYDVTVNTDERVIIIRTTNKKYYKKFNIPDMDRLNLPLQSSKISIGHANNTLIITYQKPPEILTFESTVQCELKKMKASKDGDVECTPS